MAYVISVVVFGWVQGTSSAPWTSRYSWCLVIQIGQIGNTGCRRHPEWMRHYRTIRSSLERRTRSRAYGQRRIDNHPRQPGEPDISDQGHDVRKTISQLVR